MAAVNPGERAVTTLQSLLLGLLYVFLYFPIFYIAYLSVMQNSVWPFPPEFTAAWYERLAIMSDFHDGLINSVLLGLGSGALSTLLAGLAVVGLLKYPGRWRGPMAILYVSPLFVAHVLIGISSLMFNRGVLDLPGTLASAIVANSTYGISFAFLVILAQLVRYDWRLDDVGQVFGATPFRCFREVTLPNIWPAMLGAFLITFLLAFNELEISFYNLGAIPTLPTVAWGSLRYGLKPELFALAALVNGLVFVVFVVMYVLMRMGVVRFGYRGK